VVDDGSDEPASLTLLTELKEKYKFRLLRKSHEGLSAARNAGARLARGEFLAFLDADDCMDVRFYQCAMDVLRRYENVSFVGCWAEYFGEAQGWWPTWNPEPPCALVHNPINTSALVYRRTDFLRYGLNDSSFDQSMEDYDGLLSMLENGCRGVALPDPFFKYRVRGNSKSHQAKLTMKLYTWQNLVQKHRELYRSFTDEVVNLLNANGPAYFYDNPTLWYPMLGSAPTDQPKEDINELVSKLDDLKVKNQTLRMELDEIKQSRYWKVIRWLWGQGIYLKLRRIFVKTKAPE
jgi:glycosyltransferase involved in cell wall biosynthesis